MKLYIEHSLEIINQLRTKFEEAKSDVEKLGIVKAIQMEIKAISNGLESVEIPLYHNVTINAIEENA